MIKDTRYIVRRVIIGVLISLILSFIYACEVKAQTNYNSSISINLNETSNSIDRVIYNDPNHTTKAFANVGRGYLVTIIMAYKYSDNTSFQIPTIYSVNARTDSGYSTCEVTSLSNVSDSDGSNMKANMYGVKCDLTMGTNGLISLSANFSPQVNNTWTLQVGRLTFNNNIEAEQQSWLEYIHSYMQDWIYPKLTSIDNSTSSSEAYLSWIYAYMQNYVYTKLTEVVDALTSGNTQAHNDSQAEIDAANQNTQEQIESQKVCNYIDKNNVIKQKAYLMNNGNVLETNTQYGITDFIKISSNNEIKVINTAATAASQHTCFYNINKEKISCLAAETLTGTLTIPNNSSYVRFSINSNSNKPTFEICKNGNQAMQETQEQTNDILTDDNVDDPNNSLTEMDSKIATNSVISDLLLLPITLFQNVLNNINGTCSTFNLGSLLGTNLTLPCINLSNILGSSLYGVIDILLCGVFVLSMRKKFVDIFENITSLKDRGNELE